MVFAFRIEREKYDRGPYRLVSDNVSKVRKKRIITYLKESGFNGEVIKNTLRTIKQLYLNKAELLDKIHYFPSVELATFSLYQLKL